MAQSYLVSLVVWTWSTACSAGQGGVAHMPLLTTVTVPATNVGVLPPAAGLFAARTVFGSLDADVPRSRMATAGLTSRTWMPIPLGAAVVFCNTLKQAVED